MSPDVREFLSRFDPLMPKLDIEALIVRYLHNERLGTIRHDLVVELLKEMTPLEQPTAKSAYTLELERSFKKERQRADRLELELAGVRREIALRDKHPYLDT